MRAQFTCEVHFSLVPFIWLLLLLWLLFCVLLVFFSFSIYWTNMYFWPMLIHILPSTDSFLPNVCLFASEGKKLSTKYKKLLRYPSRIKKMLSINVTLFAPHFTCIKTPKKLWRFVFYGHATIDRNMFNNNLFNILSCLRFYLLKISAGGSYLFECERIHKFFLLV